MNYNKEQQEIIDSPSKRIIVVAPPGSGKTATMTGAVVKYSKDNPDARCAVITFTNKGVNELSYRLRRENPDGNYHISTIHSWAKAEIEKLSKKHYFRIKMLGETQIKTILENLVRALGVKIKYINQAYSFIMGNKKMRISDGLRVLYTKLEGHYIEHKRENTLYDFTDYPLYLQDLLEKYNEEITNYDALFVDELQDIDPVQFNVFKKVVVDKFIGIGDPDQSIYMFRGASPEAISKFAFEMNCKTYNLRINYRSHQEIIDAAECIRTYNPDIAAMGRVLDDLPGGYTFEGDNMHTVHMSRANETLPGEEYSFVDTLDKVFIDPPEILRISERLEDFEDRHKTDFSTSFKGEGGETTAFLSPYKITSSAKNAAIFSLENYIENFKPTIICRTNRQIQDLEKLKVEGAITVHSAKGLEFDNTLIVDFSMASKEDANVAYVALTRARNRCVVADFSDIKEALENLPEIYQSSNQFLF